MAQVTWLGDADPEKQAIRMYGHEFVKGEPVTVTGEALKQLEGNPMFSTAEDAEPVESDEPEAPDPEAGTEKAALKAELRSRGIEVKGNPSLDTLRSKLANA